MKAASLQALFSARDDEITVMHLSSSQTGNALNAIISGHLNILAELNAEVASDRLPEKF